MNPNMDCQVSVLSHSNKDGLVEKTRNDTLELCLSSTDPSPSCDWSQYIAG